MQTAIALTNIKSVAEAAYLAAISKVSGYALPHEFVRDLYDAYKENNPKTSNTVNGAVFELAICETLVRAGITPFYHQAKFAFAPIVDFDIVCYHPERPVVLSAKTSLRERYKQAAFEGYLLKGIYGAAQSYLLTLSEEYKSIREKIQNETIVGLTDCLRADSPEYDELIQRIKAIRFAEAVPVVPLSGKLVR